MKRERQIQKRETPNNFFSSMKFEIEAEEYDEAMELLAENNIQVEKEIICYDV